MMSRDLLFLLVCLTPLVKLCSGVAVQLRKLPCKASFYKYPTCENTPAGYWCECGTGFEWNSKICMTDSVDSRLEFKRINEDVPGSYAILKGKNVQSLEAFTVAAWVKLEPEAKVIDRDPTLIAYAVDDVDEFRVSIGKTFKLTISKKTTRKRNWGAEDGKWIHVAVTWEKGGAWRLYKNGERVAGANRSSSSAMVLQTTEMKGGGDLTIGHMIHHLGEDKRELLGELSHVHMWDATLNESYIKDIARDCTFTYCGDVAEWVDFRSGTRGNVKLRWPSNVFDECIVNKATDCDSHCSHTIGPQCNQEYDGNILWPRTQTGHNLSRPCPGLPSDHATRECRQEDFLGVWLRANTSACVSPYLRTLRNEIEKNLVDTSSLILDFHSTFILDFLERLYNSTSNKMTRPADISASVECLRMLVAAQSAAFDDYRWGDTMLRFQKNSYPSFEVTKKFTMGVMETVNNIVDLRNDVAWNATLPRGGQAVLLLDVMETFVHLFAHSYLRHQKRGDISYGTEDADKAIVRNNLAIYMESIQPYNFRAGSLFPDPMNPNMSMLDPYVGQVKVPNTLFEELDEGSDDNEDYMYLYYVRYDRLARYLPNHPEQIIVKYYRDKDLEHRHKEDNVNSVVITTGVYSETDVNDAFLNLTVPLEISFKFTNSFNISNPECVFIDIQNGPNSWAWQTSASTNISVETDSVMCLYYGLGTFAVTTDMYDVNWSPGEPPRFVMTAAGYIGILIITGMVSISLGAFFYLRCTTDTVAVHRNLGISIICLHVLFMIGITRQENATVCKIFGIAIQYFLVTSFAWVCNEAFNLYIEVANSIHADTQQQRPMLRYYVIGWFVPAVLVAALVQSKWESYFSDDVCFADFDNIWLCAGPAIGFWAITVFVLAYTGKDIMESSYSKDKEANKVIGNHYKGCWIQAILMAISWAFGLISVDMFSLIPQILFAMFTILQGAFFFVFFCALDGEITEILAERRSAMGFNVSPHGLQRSTKYSVYRRYIPPRSSTRRNPGPTHMQTPPSHSSAPFPSSEGPSETLEMSAQPRDRGGSWSGGCGDRSPSLARWGSVAVQALRKQRISRKESSDAKREVLTRFFSEEEVKGALDDPQTPTPEPDETNEDDHLVTSV